MFLEKLAYGQAATDEERRKAHDEAERIRQQYGGYKAGTDGTGYTLSQTYAPPGSEYVSQYQDKIDQWTDKVTNQNPYSSNYGDKIDKLLEQVTNPEQYQGSYQGEIDSLTGQLQNRDPYQSQYHGEIDSLTGQLQNRDPYTSEYQGDIDSLLNQIMNREDFSYDPAADPSYQAYSEKYRSAGNQAMRNALGSAAAMNGGQLSTYALTAAQQAQNSYAAQMSDVIPQLQQLAYRMYQDEGADMRNDLAALLSQDDRDYDRALNKARTLASVGDFSGYKALGYSDEEIAKLSAPYQQSRKIGGTPGGDQPKSPSNPGLRTYEEAVSYLEQNNISSVKYVGMMTEGEWKRRKDAYRKYGQGGAEVTAYDTYPDYINAYTQYCLENSNG